MRYIFFLFCILIVQCNSIDQSEKNKQNDDNSLVNDFIKAQKELDTAQCNSILTNIAKSNRAVFPDVIEKSNYLTLYNFLKAESYIMETHNGINFQFSVLKHYSNFEMIKLLKQFESLPYIDNAIILSLKIAGLNLNRTEEKERFLKAIFFETQEAGTTDMVIISNYLKLQPNQPYFLEAFRTITQKSNKKFLKSFLIKSGYLKFNRFTDEYTTYDPGKLSHLPNGLTDTLLMKAEIIKKINN